jgi:hypothetical protein
LYEDPSHVRSHAPVFCWSFHDNDSVEQGGFVIQVGGSMGSNDYWDSGEVNSMNQFTEYNGILPLLDNQTYYFRVKVRDKDGAWSPWSSDYEFAMNARPVIIDFTPLVGIFDESIDLEWNGFDFNDDDLNYTLEAYLNGSYQTLFENEPRNNYIFDTRNFFTYQTTRFRAKCFDGYEESLNWFKTDWITIIHNNPPSISIKTPDISGALTNEYFLIQWDSTDIDTKDTHSIDLYYCLEEKDYNIKQVIELGYPDKGSYIWNTADLPEGDYYLCLEIFDGKSTNYSFSAGKLTIDHNVDTNPPRIISTEPSENSHDVPISQEIRIRFNKPMDLTTMKSEFIIVKDSLDRIVDGQLNYDNSKYRLSFDPYHSLAYGQVYTIILKSNIRDDTGNFLDGNGDYVQQKSSEDDYIWSFSTIPRSVDNTPPTILHVTPENQKKSVDTRPIITAIFSEEIDRTSLTPSPVFIYDQNGQIVETVSIYIIEENKLRIDFYGDLQSGTKYTILITSSIRDLAGHGLDSNKNDLSEGSPIDDYRWSFTTKESDSKSTSRPESDDWNSTMLISIGLALLLFLLLLSILVIKKQFKREKFNIHDIFVVYQDGRVLAHQSFESISDVDESAMGGMLTAIQNFALESFRDQDTEKLEEIAYGKLKIVLAHGKHVYLAAVCTGDFQINKFRDDISNLLILIEHRFGKVLHKWDGNMKKVRDIKELIRF